MRLESVRVQNFRSIRDATLRLGGLTALVGANGAGKSAFLKAVDLFQGEWAAVEEEDYHCKTTQDDIVITLSFGDLSAVERNAFAEYTPDGILSVEKVFSWGGNPKRRSPAVYGLRPSNPDFDIIKSGKRDEAKTHYDAIRANYGLNKWTSHDQARKNVLEWERRQGDKLDKRRDDGRTIRTAGGTTTSIDTYVKFVVVPAVRDASADAGDGKDSGTARLTDELVRDITAGKEFNDFRARTERKYGDLVAKFEATRLAEISDAVARRLDSLVGGVGVKMSWPDKSLDIGLPRTRVKLIEGGQVLDVARAGHGSQRAFIISVLEEIASPSGGGAPGGGRAQNDPALVILMEEPELYQHPVRQRHMAKVFAGMAQSQTQSRIQIVYTTHSPHFVGMDRIGDIRLIRREAGRGRRAARETAVYSTSLDDVRKALLWGGRKRLPDEAVAERLRVVMTPWLNEGFFADLVVLVEGDGDYAAILGAARSHGVELEKAGIAVIPCNGKDNMDKPLAVFKNLGIMTYMVWDADRGAAAAPRFSPHPYRGPRDPQQDMATNRRYLEMLGEAPAEWPSGVTNTHACFEDNLNATMRNEIGGTLYDRLLRETSKRLGMPARTAEKKSIIMVDILSKAREQNQPCKTLDKLVDTIRRLGGEAHGTGAEKRAPKDAGGKRTSRRQAGSKPLAERRAPKDAGGKRTSRRQAGSKPLAERRAPKDAGGKRTSRRQAGSKPLAERRAPKDAGGKRTSRRQAGSKPLAERRAPKDAGGKRTSRRQAGSKPLAERRAPKDAGGRADA